MVTDESLAVAASWCSQRHPPPTPRIARHFRRRRCLLGTADGPPRHWGPLTGLHPAPLRRSPPGRGAVRHHPRVVECSAARRKLDEPTREGKSETRCAGERGTPKPPAGADVIRSLPAGVRAGVGGGGATAAAAPRAGRGELERGARPRGKGGSSRRRGATRGFDLLLPERRHVADPHEQCSLLLPRWPGGRVVPLQRGDDDPPLRQMLIARTSLEQLVDARGDPQRQPTVVRRALAGPKAGGGPAALPLHRGCHRRMLARSRCGIRRRQLFVDVRYSTR